VVFPPLHVNVFVLQQHNIKKWNRFLNGMQITQGNGNLPASLWRLPFWTKARDPN